MQALLACEELRPYLHRELGWPLSELGRIRLRTGDIDGAEEALLAADGAGWDPQPGLALLRLAQVDLAAAAASIRDALERPLRVPSKELPPNTDLRRAPLLEAQVEIEIAAGDIDRARSAADELTVVAARFQSKALAAGAALAHGRVHLAAGNLVDGERFLTDAVRLWNEVGGPYEAARARSDLAAAFRAGGAEDRAVIELRAARTVLDRIEAARARVDPAAPGADHHELEQRVILPPDEFRREGDYWSVVFEGRTVRMRDLQGMRYLARLLADPGREFQVLDLAAAPADTNVPKGGGHAAGLSHPLGDSGEILDARAKDAYRRRLVEIDQDIEQAQATGDIERAAQADAERDFLVRELSRAVGLGGRSRRAGSASERARAGVTRALRQAMARIGGHHPQLGEHLDRTIRTGTYCSYQPDPRTPARCNL